MDPTLPEPRMWTPRTPDGRLRWTWYVVAPYMECRRKFHLSILSDLVPRDTPVPLTTGSAFHYGMEAAFKQAATMQDEFGSEAEGGPWPPSALDACRKEGIRAAQAYPNASAAIRDEASRLVWDYWEAPNNGASVSGSAARDLQEWYIHGVERSLTGPLHLVARGGARNIRWGATVDLLVHVRTPAKPVWRGLWTVNWKTSRDLRLDSFSGARREGQFLSEQVAATAWYVEDRDRIAGCVGPPRGMILAVITKAAGPAIVRDYIQWEPDEIAAWARDLSTIVSEIRARGRRGPWPMNPIACQGRYRRCDYWDLCENPNSAGAYGPRTDVWEHGSQINEYDLAEEWPV